MTDQIPRNGGCIMFQGGVIDMTVTQAFILGGALMFCFGVLVGVCALMFALSPREWKDALRRSWRE